MPIPKKPKSWINKVKAELNKSDTVSEAARVLRIPRGTIQTAFASHGLNPRDFVQKPPEPRADPITRARTKTEENHLKKEHGKLVERVREYEAREHVRDRLYASSIEPVKRYEFKSGIREATPVSVLSDVHAEESVTLEQSVGLNTYTIEECELRLGRYFAGLRWMNELYRERWSIREMVVSLAGDLLTGYIHAELLETNQLSPIETVLWLKDRLVAGIDHLLADTKLEILKMPCVPGNHGRTTDKIRIATYAKNSYEWLLYQWLADHYRDNPRVQIHADQTLHKWVDIYDSGVHVTHGDDIRYQGGVGGIAVPLLRGLPAWDDLRPGRQYIHVLGHHHTFSDFRHAVVNGSVIGFGAYSLRVKARPLPPEQMYFLMDSKRRKTCVSPLWVDELDVERMVEKSARKAKVQTWR